MSFFSTPPRDPRSSSFLLSTPPSPSSIPKHETTAPPPPPSVASSSLHQPCYATRSFPSHLQAAVSRRQCIGLVGRELPQGSRPSRAFSSHDVAPAATLGPLPPPPPLVNRPGFQYERVPTLDEVLGDKKVSFENPKPESVNAQPDDDSNSDCSYTSTQFANDMRR